MTGEDKMNRIFMYIGVIVGLALGANLPVEAQKKSLDIELPHHRPRRKGHPQLRCLQG